MQKSQSGFTLIELMVSIAILALLTLAALPELSSYLANSRMRESANTLVSSAVMARSEAIKRNDSVNFKVTGQAITIALASAPSTPLRTVQLPDGVTATTSSTVFTSAGQLAPFGSAVSISTSMKNRTCSEDIRCPAVLIEPGGAANLCARGARNGACI